MRTSTPGDIASTASAAGANRYNESTKARLKPRTSAETRRRWKSQARRRIFPVVERGLRPGKESDNDMAATPSAGTPASATSFRPFVVVDSDSAASMATRSFPRPPFRSFPRLPNWAKAP